MAFTSTVLTTTPASVFSSAGNNAVTAMYLCNTGNITAYFNVYAVPASSSPDASKLIYFRVPLTSYDTYVIDTEKLVLQNGDSLQANIIDPASIASVGLTQTAWGATDTVNSVFWSLDRDEYLIGGANSKLASSSSGESWQFQNALTTLGWPAATPVNSITRIASKKYLVAGNTGYIGISADGAIWTNHTSLSSTSWGSNNVNAVTNNGSIYLAAGANGKVATSIDGVTWTVQTSLTSTGWGNSTVWSATWTGDVFMIGGDAGKIATSADGATWTYNSNLASNPAWGASTRITNIVYSGSQATGYMVSTADSNKIAVSTNGSTWTYDAGLAAIATSATVGLGGLTFRPGYGFYVGAASSDIFHKDLSGSWTKISALNSLPWNGSAITDLIWNNERSEFVAVGSTARVATSSDGSVWTYRSSGSSVSITVPNVVVTVSSIGI